MPQDQQEEEPIPETRIEVEIPKVNTDLGNDLYFVKLPNFLSVEPRYGNQLKRLWMLNRNIWNVGIFLTYIELTNDKKWKIGHVSLVKSRVF